jgi:hypothetical protein
MATHKSRSRILLAALAKVAVHKDFYDYLESGNRPKMLVEADSQVLEEATRATVGQYTARRDPPHFVGDEYHGHVDVGGGHEISYGQISHKRRHPSKFPAQIPRDAKLAIAKVLGVQADLLESFWVKYGGKKTLLLEING